MQYTTLNTIFRFWFESFNLFSGLWVQIYYKPQFVKRNTYTHKYQVRIIRTSPLERFVPHASNSLHGACRPALSHSPSGAHSASEEAELVVTGGHSSALQSPPLSLSSCSSSSSSLLIDGEGSMPSSHFFCKWQPSYEVVLLLGVLNRELAATRRQGFATRTQLLSWGGGYVYSPASGTGIVIGVGVGVNRLRLHSLSRSPHCFWGKTSLAGVELRLHCPLPLLVIHAR